MRSIFSLFLLLILPTFIFSSCRSSASLTAEHMTFSESSLSADEFSSLIPDYSELLHTIQGDGRALVSEPGNSDRVSVRFFSNREESLIFVRNSAGIEGGQIYLDTDSLTILNRVDRIAEKVPLNRSDRSTIGSLASLNILQLFNYTVRSSEISRVYENEENFRAITHNNSQIIISRRSGAILSVVHAKNNLEAAYSSIAFDGYSLHDSFLLPGRITVTGKDGDSRVTLIVRRLEVNSDLPDLELTIPEHIPILRL